jgi:hypothetical protein
MKHTKNKVQKEVTPITIKIGKSEFDFRNIIIVSKHAPLHQIDLETLRFHTETNPTVANDIVRVCRMAKGNVLISGHAKVAEAFNKQATTISGRLISAPALYRTLLPEKILTGEELSKKLESDPRFKAPRSTKVVPKELQNQS